MTIWVWVFDPTGMDMSMIFYLWVTPVPDPNRDGYFFPSVGNPTGTRYFTSTIILDCEQVKYVYFVILIMTCSDC
jgi:hypothetical protein